MFKPDPYNKPVTSTQSKHLIACAIVVCFFFSAMLFWPLNAMKYTIPPLTYTGNNQMQEVSDTQQENRPVEEIVNNVVDAPDTSVDISTEESTENVDAVPAQTEAPTETPYTIVKDEKPLEVTTPVIPQVTQASDEIVADVKADENPTEETVTEGSGAEDGESEEMVNPYAGIVLTDYEKELLARMAYTESNDQPFDGQVAVIQTALNRYLHPAYRGSISDILFAPHQFVVGSYYTQTQMDAVESALAGNPILDCNTEVVFFSMGGLKYGSYYKTIADHVFRTYK